MGTVSGPLNVVPSRRAPVAISTTRVCLTANLASASRLPQWMGRMSRPGNVVAIIREALRAR
jgi:hypothetical protein